jgi:hypothetical protein
MVAKSVDKMGPPNVKEWDDDYHPDSDVEETELEKKEKA